MRITISNQSSNHINHYPACNCWSIVQLQVLAFLREKYKFLEFHKVPFKKPLAVLHGATWSYIENNNIKRNKWALLLYHETNEFSPRVKDEGGTDQANWALSVLMFQRCLGAAGYRSKHPDWGPKLIPDHSWCRSMLAGKPQNWNHQHWSHAIFDEESRVSVYHSDFRSVNSTCFFYAS